MNFLDKKNLFIQEDNSKGYYDFVYNPEIIMQSNRYDDVELINIVTKERIPYKEILLVSGTGNKGFYFYPPELYGTSKAIKDYAIKNWLFVNDTRVGNINNEEFQNNVTTFVKETAAAIEKTGHVVNDLAKLMNTVSKSLNEISNTFKGDDKTQIQQAPNMSYVIES